VSIIFTDIQGSTSLWEKLKDRFAPVLELHNRAMRQAIDAHKGYEVKTVGDAFMIAFQDALDAVRFAITIQEDLANYPWPAEVGELLVRIGVHTGQPIAEVNPQTGRVDYFGPMVNCSARIESAAHGGQVLIGRTTRDAIAGRIADVELLDLGEHRLKGIDSPEQIFQVVSPRIPHRDFPAISTLTALPTNLPYHQSSFVGRDREVHELSILLTKPNVRAVTLTGPGGTGKTRLSLRMGNLLLDKFEGGVWFANLARAASVEDVCAQVAGALGLTLPAGEGPERVIANVLEYRKPLLLILDNFEQVVQHGSQTLGLWMQRAPKAKFLVTSQSLLGLAGEWEYRLGALAVPPRAGAEAAGALLGGMGMASAITYDAVKLFVERAHEASEQFSLTDANARDVMAICSELDGIPLAIELAAARVKIMSPAQMVQRLNQKFQLLRSSRRDIEARHQTLQAAIEWSYELLADWEKAAFQQACVFRGGFSLEAAEAVMDLSAHADAPFPMDAVQALREKSLLTTRETPFGVRFHMFRAMREFGEGKWKPAEDLVLRHADHYLGYLREWDRKRAGAGTVESLDRVEQKRENILAAIERLLALRKLGPAAEAAALLAPTLAVRAAGGLRVAVLRSVLDAVGTEAAARAEVGTPLLLRLLVALSRAHQAQGEAKRAVEISRDAAELAGSIPPCPEAADALTNHAECCRRLSKLDEAMALHEQARAMCEALGDRPGLARNLGGRGMIEQLWNQHEKALASFSLAEKLNRELGNTTGLAANLNNRGRSLRELMRTDESLVCFDEGETLSRSVGDAAACAAVIANRQASLQLKGDLQGALACSAAAERIFRELGDKANAARCLGKRGSVLGEMGRREEALACLREACALQRELGQARSVAALRSNEATLLLELGRHAEAAVAAEEFLAYCRSNKYIRSRDGFEGCLALARAYTGTGDKAKAREAARVGLEIAGRLGIHRLKGDADLATGLAFMMSASR
jgi:predicted ATPase/class 3 adenylate cyclase